MSRTTKVRRFADAGRPLVGLLVMLGTSYACEPLRAQPQNADEPPSVEDLVKRMNALEREKRSLQHQFDALKRDFDARLSEDGPETGPKLQFAGYVDMGFFAPTGNGVGFVRDVGGTQSDSFPDVPWVVLGDPWSTVVNSRGEPADTDGSFAVPFDNIDSGGRSSFIINEINLDLFFPLTSNASVSASVDFLPRSGNGGNLGDFIDADFAFLRWEPFEEYDVEVQIGKYASAFGLEYRREESNARTGITPSLIWRYVSGHPLGIKVRSSFFQKQLVANIALNNGSSNIEAFPFGSEIDVNDSKTISGRLSYDFARLIDDIDILMVGISGEWGAQVRQSDNEVYQRQAGIDLQIAAGDFELRAEALIGKAPGQGQAGAEALDFDGAYLQLSYRFLDTLTPYVRIGYREAEHIAETFAYVVDVSRVTVGLNVEFADGITGKFEFLHNMEHGAVPDFDNDLLTASLVLSF
ncbi:MAG: outer membrane beta-barrel protein [Planctomycetota bacterium]